MRIRNKLLLAMMVAVGLLVIQIAAVSFFIRELQSAVTFIASAQTVIESDFVAAELVAKLREEIKKLPSGYVTERDPAQANESSALWDELVSHIAFIRASNAAHEIEPKLLDRLELTFFKAEEERARTICRRPHGSRSSH